MVLLAAGLAGAVLAHPWTVIHPSDHRPSPSPEFTRPIEARTSKFEPNHSMSYHHRHHQSDHRSPSPTITTVQSFSAIPFPPHPRFHLHPHLHPIPISAISAIVPMHLATCNWRWYMVTHTMQMCIDLISHPVSKTQQQSTHASTFSAFMSFPNPSFVFHTVPLIIFVLCLWPFNRPSPGFHLHQFDS